MTQNACLTGTIVRLHLEVMSERYGKSVVDAVIRTLQASQRSELMQMLPIDWVRVDTIAALYERLADRLGRTVEALHWEIGTEVVDRTFRTVWRILLRITTDEALVSRTPLLYSKTYNVGELKSRIVRPGMAEITLTGWPNPPAWVVRGLCIAVTTVLRFAGRRNPQVVPDRAKLGTSLRATWQP